MLKMGRTCIRSAYPILICLERRYNVLDGTLNEHASDKAEAFSTRLLGECFVESR